MSTVTEGKTVDLDELERDARSQLETARARRQQLALDALTDVTARKQLGTCERQLGEAEDALERVSLARAEVERREVEAREAKVSERQEAAFAEACQLQVRRERAAKAVDRTAVEFVSAVVEHVNASREQQRKLREAGRLALADVARPRRWAYEGALARALQRATWRGGPLIGLWERLPYIWPAHKRLLGESDARPVEPSGDE